MKGSEWVATLPPAPCAERDAAVLDAIRAGWWLPPTWLPVLTDAGEHKGILYVSSDTLRIGEPDDSCRIMVTATMAQQIADLLGYVMPTPKICDLIHKQATVLIEPYLTTPDAHMADTARMVDVNAEVDRRIAGLPGLASSWHKDWVLSTRLAGSSGAVNYGYYSAKAPYVSHSGLRMWQCIGTKHNAQHQDASQQMRCVWRQMSVDDVRCDVASVLTSPELSGLVSDEGPLTFSRQPGVAPLQRLAGTEVQEEQLT